MIDDLIDIIKHWLTDLYWLISWFQLFWFYGFKSTIVYYIISTKLVLYLFSTFNCVNWTHLLSHSKDKRWGKVGVFNLKIKKQKKKALTENIYYFFIQNLLLLWGFQRAKHLLFQLKTFSLCKHNITIKKMFTDFYEKKNYVDFHLMKIEFVGG